MNMEQRRYLTSRIDEYLEEQTELLKLEYTKPGKELSDEERFKLVASGKVKVKKDVDEISTYDKVANVFDFSAHEYDDMVDKKTFEKAKMALRKRCNRVRDEAMLGDLDQAKKLLLDLIGGKA